MTSAIVPSYRVFSRVMLRPMADDNTSFTEVARRRAGRWLAAWDAQGIHRTATSGDNAGADWLAQEAAALGAEVAIEDFPLARLDPVMAFLEIRGARIEAVPAFDAPPSDAGGVTGRLGFAGGAAEIAVAELSPRAVYSGDYETLRRSGGHRGFVILCAGEQPGLGLLNAELFRAPYGAPTVHVATEARATVLAAAGQGAPARLVAYSRRTPARARNVVATLPGGASAKDGAPLIVMTPRSSWWQSTAERGGGLVAWLETLRALLAAPPAVPVIFTANTGHELGHLGLDDFIARRPGHDRPVRQGGATWVHYGANLGAAGGALSLVSPDDELRAIAAAELTRTGQTHAMAPKTLMPSGETRDIHRAGGRYLTLVGSNPLFHLPQDRWPHAVDLDAVTRIAAASARIVLAMTRQ
jgi:hypothetical protein